MSALQILRIDTSINGIPVCWVTYGPSRWLYYLPYGWGPIRVAKSVGQISVVIWVEANESWNMGITVQLK
jgi:hypothetical protein